MGSPYIRRSLMPEPDPSILCELLRKRAGIGATHWSFTLQELHRPDCDAYRPAILNYVKKMHETEPKGWGLYLWGAPARGKTSIASNILKQAIARGGRALSIRCNAMVNSLANLKKTIIAPDDIPLEQAAKNIQYLLIDDFQLQDQTWKSDLLEEVIRSRYDERLPTILTSNLKGDEICKDHNLDWLSSILSERYLSLNIDGPDWRKINRGK